MFFDKIDTRLSSTITKYHRYQTKAEFQIKNEPVPSRPYYMSKVINALYAMDPVAYSNIWDKQLNLKKIYEVANARERLRMTEYRLRESEHRMSSIGRMLTREKMGRVEMREWAEIAQESMSDIVVFVVPIKGRTDTFRRFLGHWEELAANDTKLGLVVSLFGTRSQIEAIEQIMEELKQRHRNHIIKYHALDQALGHTSISLL